jgi:hypothetical protein
MTWGLGVETTVYEWPDRAPDLDILCIPKPNGHIVFLAQGDDLIAIPVDDFETIVAAVMGAIMAARMASA